MYAGGWTCDTPCSDAMVDADSSAALRATCTSYTSGMSLEMYRSAMGLTRSRINFVLPAPPLICNSLAALNSTSASYGTPNAG